MSCGIMSNSHCVVSMNGRRPLELRASKTKQAHLLKRDLLAHERLARRDVSHRPSRCCTLNACWPLQRSHGAPSRAHAWRGRSCLPYTPRSSHAPGPGYF